MEIIISHISALEYWRHWRAHGDGKITDLARLRGKSPPASLPHSINIRGAVPKRLLNPVIILVGNKNIARKSNIVQSRVFTAPTPDGCFIGIDGGLAVSSPAFCFFQMADELPMVKLIELGLELCGTYSLPVKREHCSESSFRNEAGGENPNGNRKEVAAETLYGHVEGIADKTMNGLGDENPYENLYGHPQLTSKKAIMALTARLKGANGQKKACRALRYIADGSASPMETILFMLLTLPHSLGGYGLPPPVFNRRIGPRNAARQGFGKAYYKCDLFWPDADFAVEYDSDLYHTGADRIADDSDKRLDLAKNRITVITVTNRQIRDVNAFEGIAKLIAGRLNKQLRYGNRRKFLEARRELRSLLFMKRPALLSPRQQ